jgi:hypothetical protein
MTAVWYRVKNGETVGPSGTADILDQIKLSGGRSFLVWTEGMADWTDARAIPSFSQLFQPLVPQSSRGSYATKSIKPVAAVRLSRRLRHELTE